MRRTLWALIVGLPLVALLWTGFGRNPAVVASPLLDKPAPAFTLHALDGKTVSLQALRGKPVVVNFWASWCGPCADEHPYLLQAFRKYGPQGVRFVGISFKDSSGAARSFLRKRGGGWPDLQDPDVRTALDYGVTGVPETFLIDRSGVVRFKSTGPIVPGSALTPEIFDRELQSLLGGRA